VFVDLCHVSGWQFHAASLFLLSISHEFHVSGWRLLARTPNQRDHNPSIIGEMSNLPTFGAL
jgi:hypothetical protein